MPKYMVIGNYVGDGIQGLMSEGGSARRAVVEKMCANVGGRLESMYYAFGSDDVYVIVDLPDNATAAAMSLVASASGAVRTRTTVLLTPEEMDQATRKSVDYQPPTVR